MKALEWKSEVANSDKIAISNNKHKDFEITFVIFTRNIGLINTLIE
jgi:hypothetical protein